MFCQTHSILYLVFVLNIVTMFKTLDIAYLYSSLSALIHSLSVLFYSFLSVLFYSFLSVLFYSLLSA